MDAPNEEITHMVNEIASVIGLASDKFIVKVGNIPYAGAIYNRVNRKRYIVISLNFFESLNNINESMYQWMAKSILAHELAHHLNGDTFESKPDRHDNELNADIFSGFAMAKLNCGNLNVAQLALSTISSGSEISPKYPPRGARLEAIAIGYKKADLDTNREIKIPSKAASLGVGLNAGAWEGYYNLDSISGKEYLDLDVGIYAGQYELSNIAAVVYTISIGDSEPEVFTMYNPDDGFFCKAKKYDNEDTQVLAVVYYKDGTTKQLSRKFIR